MNGHPRPSSGTSGQARLIRDVRQSEELVADPTRRFFAGLADQHAPLPRGLSGLIRADVKDGNRAERYFVQIRMGAVTVFREGSEADCVITGDRATFDAVVTGEMNAIDAVLRNLLAVQGDALLLTALQRLIPSSPGIDYLSSAGYAERQS